MCKTSRVVGGMGDMCAPHHVKDDAVCVDKCRVSGPPTAYLQTSNNVPWVATMTRWCAIIVHGDMLVRAQARAVLLLWCCVVAVVVSSRGERCRHNSACTRSCLLAWTFCARIHMHRTEVLP